MFEGDGVDMLTVAGLTVGTVSLAYGGAGIAITGLVIGAASASGAEWTINPEYDSLASGEQIRVVVELMIRGFEKASEDAEELREECRGELERLSGDHFNDRGKVSLVPGSGYYE